MSKAEDEQQTRLDRAREIGLFRYMLIREAADPGLSKRERGAMIRDIASQSHKDPFGRIVKLTRWTLDRWVKDWRVGGFDALIPSPRQSQPRTPPEVLELASALKKENPNRTAAQIRRILHTQLGWAPDESTLQRMFVRTGLTALVSGPVTPAVVLGNLFWYHLSNFFWPHLGVWQLDLAPPLGCSYFSSMQLLTGAGGARTSYSSGVQTSSRDQPAQR